MDRLSFDPKCNNIGRHEEGITSGQAFSVKVVRMRCVDNHNKAMEVKVIGIWWEVIGIQVEGDRIQGYTREIIIRYGTPIGKSPISSTAKVFGNPFQGDEMDTS
jgi:hypothetical protein